MIGALSGWLGLLSLIWGLGLLIETNILRETMEARYTRRLVNIVTLVAGSLLTLGASGIVLRFMAHY